jgi:hypothetical protein
MGMAGSQSLAVYLADPRISGQERWRWPVDAVARRSCLSVPASDVLVAALRTLARAAAGGAR